MNQYFRVNSLCRQGLTFASAAVSRMPDFAAPGPPAEEEEQRNFERRLHAVSVLVSWYSAPASSMAAGLAANPASGGHMLHKSPIQACFWLTQGTQHNEEEQKKKKLRFSAIITGAS